MAEPIVVQESVKTTAPTLPGIVTMDVPEEPKEKTLVSSQDTTTGIVTPAPAFTQGPGTAEVADLTPVVEQKKKDTEQLTEQATKDTEALIAENKAGSEAIQQKLSEDTEKLKTKAAEETEKRIAQQEVLKKKIDTENLARRALDVKNTTNAFSHQIAQGKDSGFINALNMSSLRQANKRYSDSKLSLDLQFIQDSNNLRNKEFDTIFRLDEGLLGKLTEMDVATLNYSTGMKEKLNTYKQGLQENLSNAELKVMELEITSQFEADQDLQEEWDASAKSLIDTLLANGDVDQAIELAEQASEVSNNAYFKMFLQKPIRDSLMDNNNQEMVTKWGNTLNQINKWALDASSMDAVMSAEVVNQMFAQMEATPNQATTFMHNTWANLSPEDMERFNISDVEQGVMKDFMEGNRDFNDPSVKEAFGKAFIEDAKRDADEFKYNSLADNADIPEVIKSSPVGNELIDDWLKSGLGTENYLEVDIAEDNVLGQAGITRMQFFDVQIDPTDINQFLSLPGFDITIGGFTGDVGTENADSDVWTDNYKPKDASGKKTIGGVEYNNRDLIDGYLSYYKSFSEKWAGSSANDRIDMKRPMSRDEWADELRTQNASGATDLKGFNDLMLQDKNSVTAPSGAVVRFTDEMKMMGKTEKETFREIVTDGNINNLHRTDFLNVMSAPGAEPALRELNKTEDLYLDVPAAVNDEQLERGTLLTEKNHAFSTDNFENVLSKLKPDAGTNTFSGNIMYNGAPHSVSVEPFVHHNAANDDAYWGPVGKMVITPLGGGDPKTITVRLPGTGQENPNAFDNPKDARNRAQEVADNWFKQMTGGQ